MRSIVYPLVVAFLLLLLFTFLGFRRCGLRAGCRLRLRLRFRRRYGLLRRFLNVFGYFLRGGFVLAVEILVAALLLVHLLVLLVLAALFLAGFLYVLLVVERLFGFLYHNLLHHLGFE